ncbi:hypothetical protein [Actinokineospora pegani]|uniref:hypothetical protein n=1 Tax=Actinokineospora pegani TaxID=2654637 RepID=UPI0012E99D76|nr:hypothetical protein [Actinokineospora pegani]
MTVPHTRAIALLLGFSALLSLASMAVPALTDHPLTTGRGEIRLYLDVLEESNLPTWWSTALLVGTALAFAGVGVLARADGRPGAWTWWAAAGVLALLSLDDHTSLHERLDTVGRRFVEFDSFPFYWVVPGALAGLAVAGAMLLLAARLRGPARRCLVAGLALLLTAALGMELVQGLLLADGETGPRYVLTYHAEELAENVGVLLMLAAAVLSVRTERAGGGFALRYTGTPVARRESESVPPRHERPTNLDPQQALGRIDPTRAGRR